MKNKQLKEANDIQHNLTVLKAALESIKNFRSDPKCGNNRLQICEYSDGSGHRVGLNGATLFNEHMKVVVHQELELFIKELETRFENL